MFMLYDRCRHPGCVICNTRYTQHFCSLVPCGDSLRNGRHTDDVRPETSVHAYLGRRFICRTRESAIDTAVDKLRELSITTRVEAFAGDGGRFLDRDLMKLPIVD